MNDSADDLLVVEGLEVHFPIRRGIVMDRTVGHVKAVDGVDLRVPRGRTYGLVGESGCGKSTLGRAVLRLEEPTAGSVTLDGVDVATLKGEPLRKLRRRMQMVFQDPLASLDPRQSVQSLMIEPLRVHDPRPNAELVARAAEMLELVGDAPLGAGQIPARVLRRPAAADRDRSGDDPQPRPGDRR